MENEFSLFMVMLGCRPDWRFTEQHDIFFGIGRNLNELVPQMNRFWPEAQGKLHVDAWRKVTFVEGYTIEIKPKGSKKQASEKLFFINLGGYKKGEFEEYHYKILTVAPSLADAVKKAKATSFYKHYGFKGAVSHIDDKFGIDVDDTYNVAELLTSEFSENYELRITKSEHSKEDELHIGYLNLNKL